MAEENPAAQRQTAVTADFLSHLLLLFDLLVKNPAAQKQTAVTAYFSK